MIFKPISKTNLTDVYRLFQKNEHFYNIPLQYFKSGTIEDENFEPELSLVLEDHKIEKPIGVFLAVIRELFGKKQSFLKMCIIDKEKRRQGIGTEMLNELIQQIRKKNSGISSIHYGNSVPNFWQPGVDKRHTDLYFFLKKNKFREKGTRNNLIADVKKINREPKLKLTSFKFERVRSKDYKQLNAFVKHEFPFGTWATEVKYSLLNTPPTTFIAKNKENDIVGWASHSQFFPGSFGPTGVKQELRGTGIGTELLYWCIWDMKKSGIDKSTIMWVGGDTIKFYSKTVDAYIGETFAIMSKKI
ncbi:MAG: GNAT family N-acetyltransferase [Candidatus Thorarchaeota archaeon]